MNIKYILFSLCYIPSLAFANPSENAAVSRVGEVESGEHGASELE